MNFATDSNDVGELRLEGFLPYRLANIAERISQALSLIYAEQFDLTIAQWRILAWLQQERTLSAKRICELTAMDKARVSRAVNQLVDRDLIQRRRDSEDQRTQWLSLAPAGLSLLKDVIPRALDWEAEIVATLSATEYRDLLRLLSKVEKGLARLESPSQDTASPSGSN
ncbi:DNA-binding MarR family transcriptional regulator [Modicisalibacter xianhensis]|uniref:DNA-binding MarR family transcriptional regulator n=1 Tax=Modicisalibacter xianhensis TaxID=442341 RepID=A0A4R8G7B8_9GAMM|nr:MarR family winged helix-turn-helix transcriptional regulator [Halomonas xianhensis]TDX32751.1 DNA-binding MarR family transcriptional regulator [Halomonas xianhensis]